MRALINIFLLAGLSLTQACSDRDKIESGANTHSKVEFSATMLNKEAVKSRALNDERGEVVALPYINGIYIRKESPTQGGETAEYNVESGHKGTLVSADATPIEWDNDLNSSVGFLGWTTPTGVSIVEDGTSGTVDFALGNVYLEAVVNKVNDNYVTPLEAFIGSSVVTSTHKDSPSVSLAFKHLVSKLSIRVRNWNNELVTDNVEITFLGIKDNWLLGNVGNGIMIKSPDPAASTADLTFICTDLKNDEKAPQFKRIYLPPLTTELGTDFNKAGDFCIEYGGKEYYGTLSSAGSSITQLQAGEHLHVTMDLSTNFGVGVGTAIADWGYGESDVIEGDPYKGIYTYADLKRVADSVNTGGAIPPLLVDNGVIRLYRNIQIGADWVPIGNDAAFPFKLEFDGNGYTISGGAAVSSAGLFGYVEGATIRNLSLSNYRLTADEADGAGLLIGNVMVATPTPTPTTVENCRVLGISSVINTGGDAGGLIGAVDAGSTVNLSNCSVETSGAIIGDAATAGGVAGVLVGNSEGTSNIANCFTVFADKNSVELVGSGNSSATISYSYLWNIFNDNAGGSFWGNTSESGAITFVKSDASASSVDISGATSSTPLLQALQVGTTPPAKGWVYVYGKHYPVLRIK